MEGGEKLPRGLSRIEGQVPHDIVDLGLAARPHWKEAFTHGLIFWILHSFIHWKMF